MNSLDVSIINWLSQMMHTYIPLTNQYIFGFPFGEYAFYCLLFYILGELYLIKSGNWGKKKVSK
jgi:hypothetical protein